MATEVISFREYEPKGSHKLLIDANIFIYTYTALAGQDDKKRVVGKFFDDCKRVDADLLITSHILSEFFHVNLNIYFDQWVVANSESKKYSLKRDYRPTQDFKDSVASINHQISGLLSQTVKISDDFQNVDAAELQLMSEHCEFNDSLVLEIANKNDYYLVTNDNDHINHPKRTCKIITF